MSLKIHHQNDVIIFFPFSSLFKPSSPKKIWWSPLFYCTCSYRILERLLFHAKWTYVSYEDL